MKKKLLSVLLCTAMAAGLVMGCGSAKGTETKTDDASKEAETEDSAAAAGDLSFEIVSKGFQHQYWQAVLKGAEQKAEELGVKINFVGPNSESDIADQVQMLNNAVNQQPDAIGLAALDTSSCLDAIQTAQDNDIPIVGFDSGVANAPDGAVYATCSTDNYAAGELAAEMTYEAIKDRIADASESVRIGVMSQDATSESQINRGLGFIDKMGELIIADGKTVNVEGNEKFVSGAVCEKTKDADVVIEVTVPASVDAALSATDCANLLNKADTIAVYGANQHSGEAMVTGNENLGKFGTKEGQVIGVAFDSGAVIKGAVADGTFLGAITQAPVAMGETLVDLLYKVANGESVSDIDTGCQWYTADNMDDPEIAQNLYD
ncbi:LacI family transcriptional regulator [Eubacterium sp. am_0171]|uniref:substrate-binding domain-containing protein n=1 Tax=unclassified Eubacterium (in: firmicutes) TaxID=2624479 RepID=UPI001020D47F|nr:MULTISPECIES: substrate-binding domain-containing protein [unclassified Eubacterium (in: firmicutes)]MBS6762771.1 substrate-binding domain-containing protein [Clostridium sp.]MDU7706191.1 substrate-binding domain-containing protein [Clostridium sp.]MSC83369.1 substrate-binding domain-containing protein [Eubacterium sp. BIOML-A1]MSD05293.1 substrate-binding domain-containing protein [Eubacterium sp. BIOML-A2]RYT24950.1 LacI family transcriptional regulator [Eubacterium sp. am_0171]